MRRKVEPMKYDELVKKIEWLTCCSGAHELALMSVVKMHEPQEITLPDGDWGSNCRTCDGYVYPCKTVQTIIEALF